MKRFPLAGLLLTIAVPVQAQFKPIQKWEYASLYSNAFVHIARWMAPDTVMTTKTLSAVTEYLGGKSTEPDFGLFSEFLNAAGAKGWELVQCEDSPGGQSSTSCYFKRPKN